MSFLPERDRAYLAEKGIAYNEREDGGQRGIILPSYRIPGQLTASQAELLILLPPGYADVPPDMFYTLPWLRLAANNNFPRAANVAHAFAGQSWQRWSRHSGEWRPGVDGIWTMLKRVDHALESAA
jgi:hypothetical protein